MSETPQRKGWTRTFFPIGMLGWELLKSVAHAFVGRPSKTVVPVVSLSSEEEGRAADRNEDLEEGVNLERRKMWGTLIVSCALLIAAAAGVGFQWVYWTDSGNNLLLGGTLALMLGAIGAGLVFHAHRLMIHKQAIEPREELPSSPVEREEIHTTYSEARHDVQRRRLLTGMAGIGILGIAAAVVSYVRSLGTPPGEVLFDTVWKRGQRLMTTDQRVMTVDSLGTGDTVVVFPEDQIGSEHAQTVLIRVDPKLLRMPRERSDWAPHGYVAFSRVCTHAGCVVGLYEKTVCQLLCPCHQSTFDVLRAAHPTGGPAARPLPQLPLYADADGTLRAGGGFNVPPGPGFWGMPA